MRRWWGRRFRRAGRPARQRPSTPPAPTCYAASAGPSTPPPPTTPRPVSLRVLRNGTTSPGRRRPFTAVMSPRRCARPRHPFSVVLCESGWMVGDADRPAGGRAPAPLWLLVLPGSGIRRGRALGGGRLRRRVLILPVYVAVLGTRDTVAILTVAQLDLNGSRGWINRPPPGRRLRRRSDPCRDRRCAGAHYCAVGALTRVIGAFLLAMVVWPLRPRTWSVGDRVFVVVGATSAS